MYSHLAIVILTWVLASANDEWRGYKDKFHKTYGSQKEEETRRLVWEKNVEVIKKHNQEADMGRHSYTLGLNDLADMANSEIQSGGRHGHPYLQVYAGMTSNEYLVQSTGLLSGEGPGPVHSKRGLPEKVDWRAKGYVTPVKNQGQCGSQWAFSAIGALEGQHFKKTGKLVALSEQNLVDCDKDNDGCNGGYMHRAYDYIRENGGINSESEYPYEAKDGVCKFKKINVAATLLSYKNITEGSEDDLQRAVATVGPVAVAINAESVTFQMYSGGVYDNPRCNGKRLDHAVVVVGYGVDKGKDYWLIKNSWGSSWGEKGYIRMARNKNNQCGIANMASYPVV